LGPKLHVSRMLFDAWWVGLMHAADVENASARLCSVQAISKD
jgi:hypothetical protein